jgi:predicted protein tyrosine phosphatase
MKVVTMCQGGHVRSVSLKHLLKYKYGHDTLACGWQSNTDETRAMLFEWADKIVIMQPNMEKYVPEKFHFDSEGKRKLFCYDVGEDTYGNPFHQTLQRNLDIMIQKHGLFV